MRLFKYAPLDRIDILLDEAIRYTQPGDLNDPYEMRLDFAALRSDDYSLFQRSIESLTIDAATKFYETYREHLPAQKEQIVELYMDLVRNPNTRSQLAHLGSALVPDVSPLLDTQWIDALDNTIGVLSLSEVPDNLLMWSHYGEQHSGIVIEFDGYHETLGGGRETKTVANTLHRVVYSEYRPTVLDQHNFTTLFLTKAPDWDYEKEWRIFKPLSEAKQIINRRSFNIHLLSMPADCVKRVIFGARTPDHVIAHEVAKIRTRSKLAHVKLTRAMRRRDRFGLDIDGEV
jgi:Protein of unknown function (DUF2971)